MNNTKLIGAILLISGTSIGAGMLALPVITAQYGFIPSVILFVVAWVFMTYSALLMLEANLWLPTNTNMISMAKTTLGKPGEALAWIAYLLLLYCLMAAYLSGLDAMLTLTVKHWLHLKLGLFSGAVILIAIFGIIIYLGAKTIDYINRLFMLGLFISYILIAIFITPHVDFSYLNTIHVNGLWLALPVVITSFGYQIIIPSLRPYLNSDIPQLRKAILIGSTVPLLVYLLWEFLIMGVIPVHGHFSLLKILAGGQPAVDLTKALQVLLQRPYIAKIEKYFTFFVITTSFIGVAFSLFDFLADGFHIKKTKLGRLSTALLTFIPPFIFTLIYPRGFMVALGFAGIFVAVLLCIMPAFMVLSGRYLKKITSEYRVKGGILPIILLIFFSIAVITFELITK